MPKFSIKDGKLTYEASYGGPGEVGFNDDWLQLLADQQSQRILALCGTALEAATNPALQRPLSRRFLDSAKWYGEGARESSNAAKVVKYVTALERMLMTDEQDNIANTVSERVAAFCLDPYVTNDYVRLKNEAQRAYSIRSKLVHGSMSHDDDRIYDGIRIASEIGRNAVLNCLMAIGHQGLRTEAASAKEVTKWFNGCVAYSRDNQNRFNNIGAHI